MSIQDKRVTADMCIRGCNYPIDRDSGSWKKCRFCLADDQRSHSLREKRKRQRVYDHYGGQCTCDHGQDFCGCTIYEFLTMHHPNFDGAEERSRDKRSAINIILGHLEKYGKWPDGWQVLCGSCHNAITNYGHCPLALKGGVLRGNLVDLEARVVEVGVRYEMQRVPSHPAS